MFILIPKARIPYFYVLIKFLLAALPLHSVIKLAVNGVGGDALGAQLTTHEHRRGIGASCFLDLRGLAILPLPMGADGVELAHSVP